MRTLFSMNTALKVIGAVVTFFGVILIIFAYKDVIPFFTNSPAERLESLWIRDLTTLIGNKSLHEGFFKVKEIKYNPVSESTKAWLKDIEPPLKTKPDGTYKLDVLLDDWADGKDFGIMIQYQLIDLSSGDTVWELGRTLTLGEKEITTTTQPAASTSTTK